MGVEDAVNPLGPAANTALYQTAVDVALALPGAHGGKDFQIGLVQEAGGVFE
jgi:hypothetical protein